VRQDELNQLQLLWSMVCQGQIKTVLMAGGPGLERSLENDRMDLDSTIEKKSRPYTLVCSKNSPLMKRF
jgi:hypothetical protein